MTDGQKRLINYAVLFIAGVLISLLVTLAICNRRIDRADSAAATLRNDLSEAKAELTRSRETIEAIRIINSELGTKQSEITTGLAEGNEGLRGVIESLQSIRDKVQGIESQLDYYDSCNSGNDISSNGDDS